MTNRIALFVISEFPQDPDKDTSYLFMMEAQKRGFGDDFAQGSSYCEWRSRL